MDTFFTLVFFAGIRLSCVSSPRTVPMMRCFGGSLNNLLNKQSISGDLRCHDAHLMSLRYNTVTYISLISNLSNNVVVHNVNRLDQKISNLWIRFSWISFKVASVIYKCITRCIVKLVGLQFKNPYKMLPTMHIFGNIDTLEIPSILIDTDAYINKFTLLCWSSVAERERWLRPSSNTYLRRKLYNLFVRVMICCLTWSRP